MLSCRDSRKSALLQQRGTGKGEQPRGVSEFFSGTTPASPAATAALAMTPRPYADLEALPRFTLVETYRLCLTRCIGDACTGGLVHGGNKPRHDGGSIQTPSAPLCLVGGTARGTLASSGGVQVYLTIPSAGRYWSQSPALQPAAFRGLAGFPFLADHPQPMSCVDAKLRKVQLPCPSAHARSWPPR